MFKRNGIAVMPKVKNYNKNKASDQLAILYDKQYTSPCGKVIDFANELDLCVKNTKIYKTTPIISSKEVTPIIDIVGEKTITTANHLSSLGKDNILVLNFAAARNPGGGFLSGAQAQEEDLCRCSGLYSCLTSKPQFYNENLLSEDTYYTDDMIYSPNVPVIRDENLALLEEPSFISIISAPAPNVTGLKDLDEVKLKKVLKNRISKILSIAADNNHKNLILGAWGCGAFGNATVIVANLFKECLEEMKCFEYIAFSIYENSSIKEKFDIFNKVFKC